MTTSLDQLKQTGTTVVSDSGDFESKQRSSYSLPTDAEDRVSHSH